MDRGASILAMLMQQEQRDEARLWSLPHRSGSCPTSPAQGSFQLHWPLINSDHMATQLAKRELEKKRVEDARL